MMTILLQVAYFMAAAVALFLFFSGIIRFIKLANTPLVLTTTLKDQDTPFTAPRAGYYMIIAEGFNHVTIPENFSASVSSVETGKEFPVYENWADTNRKIAPSANFLSFEVPVAGDYVLTLRNTAGTKGVKRLLREPVPENTPLLVRATRSWRYRMVALLMVVVGANGSVWTIILCVNPHVFG